MYYRSVSVFCATTKKLYGVLNQFYFSLERNMSRVLVRRVEGEQRMQISLKYDAQGDPSRTRQFNFDRYQTEELEKTLARIQGNISRTLAKKLKKKRKRANERDAADKSRPEPNEQDLVKVTLYDGTRQVVDGSTLNSEAWQNGNRLSIDGVDYNIVLNPPSVSKLALPNCLLVGFSAHPKICSEFTDLKQSEFIWYREVKGTEDKNSDQIRWTEISQGYIYTPTADDIGLRLKVKCVPHRDTEVGELIEAVSKSEVRHISESFPFEKRHEATKEYTSNNDFRLVSYNILADIYADSDYTRDYLFPYCPPHALDINYRKHLFIKEIAGYKADIICLQEVDNRVFVGDLMPAFELQGYEGLLKIKSESTNEGTATFYRTKKFKLCSSHDICLVDVLASDELFKDLYDKVLSNESFSKLMLDRPTTLQVSVLESVSEPKNRILVATTHLYFHPRACNVRLMQTYICIKYLEQLLNQYEEKPRPSIIFCGDFNSYPEGGVHQLLTQGHIPANHADWYSGGKEQFIEGLQLAHGLVLTSACGYPRYTNYVSGFSACLDYIYIEKDKLETVSVVPLPTHEEVTKYTALPNIVFPSDHMALVCNLKCL